MLFDPALPGTLPQQKQALRYALMHRRAEAHAANPDAGLMLRDVFLQHLTLPPQSTVSLYRALTNEIDPAPLGEALLSRGHKLCLPVVIGKRLPLVFRVYRPGDTLASGIWKIQEPLESAPLAEPDVVLAPLLGFDKAGRRLGYGGGFYDRTLILLRAKHKVMAIGVGFAAQEASSIPTDASDAILDVMVTERSIIWPIKAAVAPH